MAIKVLTSWCWSIECDRKTFKSFFHECSDVNPSCHIEKTVRKQCMLLPIWHSSMLGLYGISVTCSPVPTNHHIVGISENHLSSIRWFQLVYLATNIFLIECMVVVAWTHVNIVVAWTREMLDLFHKSPYVMKRIMWCTCVMIIVGSGHTVLSRTPTQPLLYHASKNT